MKKLTKEQAKDIWKNHKKEILIGGAVLVGGTAVCIFTGKSINKQYKHYKDVVRDLKALSNTKYTKLDIPKNVALMGISEISSKNFDEYADIWLDMTSLRDLGDFGKSLIDAYGWDPDSTITGVVSTGFVCGD